MKILVIGGGGREHALIWKMAQSPHVQEMFCAPGNGGIAELATCVDVPLDDPAAMAQWAAKQSIDLTVVGPEGALAQGVVDKFQKRKLAIFGPARQAAQLEISKAFTKECCTRWNIPTAAYAIFDQPEAAKAYIKEQGVPIVVKADGLCAGKGTIVASTMNEALGAVSLIMEDRVFGDAGRRVVVEAALTGEEVSLLAICDGQRAVLLPSAQDHKRLLDGDRGPNTGGMGAYSPAPLMTGELQTEITQRIIQPTLAGLAREGVTFCGVLYAGIMVTADGPQLLEYNVRFGDPEAQAVLPRLKSDLVDLLCASVVGKLEGVALEWDTRASVCVVAAAEGYPGEYPTGKVITGIGDAAHQRDVVVFHAGTRQQGDGMVTAGGRVLNVVALDAELEQAVKKAYHAIEQITYEGIYYRHDIAWHALKAGQA